MNEACIVLAEEMTKWMTESNIARVTLAVSRLRAALCMGRPGNTSRPPGVLAEARRGRRSRGGDTDPCD